MKKCIHVVAIEGYEPEMCSITIPTIQNYAKKINADFNLISKTKFDGFPPNYERFQIWESGKDYEWNLNIDADFLIHPGCEDPTTYLDKATVGTLMAFSINAVFKNNKYFTRDGRNTGLSDNYIITSSLTHDLWEPFVGSFEEVKKMCLPHQERRVSEFVVSNNLAKYGLKMCGVIADRSKIYHLNKTTDSIKNPAEVAKKVLEKWEKGEFVSVHGGAYNY
jgi:hypothetical protein